MPKAFVAQELIAFAKAHPVLVGFNTLLSFTFPIDDILVPFLLGVIVTRIEKKKNWLKPLIMLTTIFITMQVIYTTMYWHDARLIPKLQDFIKHRIIQAMSAAYDGRPIDFNTGEVLSRIVKTPVYITSFYQQMKNWTLPYMVSFLITACIVISYDRKIGVIVLTAGILVFALIFASPHLCKTVAEKQEQTQTAVDEQADDVLQNLQNIYAANTLPRELDRLEGFEEDYENSYKRTINHIVAYRLIATTILAIMVTSVIVLARRGIHKGALSTGALITILTIIAQWFATLGWLAGQMRDMVIDWGIISSFKLPQPDIFTRSEEGDATAKESVYADSLINVVNVSLVLPPNPPERPQAVQILHNVSLSIRAGERVAIIGEIGSGKSTLLKMLMNFYPPTSGAIYLNGTNLSKIPKEDLRKLIAYVPQNPTLFNRTIYENITYGAKEPLPDVEVIDDLLKSLGFTNTKRRVGKGGQNLSGGQRQIVATLRAIFQSPQILLLDEFTSSIDAETKRKFFDVLDYLFMGKTVVLVTHDKDVLQLATRTVYMKQGRLEEEKTRSHRNGYI